MEGSLVQVVLPIVLAFMMLTMGLGLTGADFRRVATEPKAFMTGAINQVVLLPIVTFAVATFAGLDPLLSAGLMILAACPGGVTSNVLTHYAKGDSALSISLTAVISLLGFFTIPFIVQFAMTHFVGTASAVAAPTELIAGSVFVITILPVTIGMLIRRFASGFATKAMPIANKTSAVLFVIVVVGAVAKNWALFKENVAVLGPAILTLIVVMMAIGFGTSRAMRLSDKQSTTIALETGVQNATMGLFIGTSLIGQAELSLPSAIYGVMMYAPALVLVSWLRRNQESTAVPAK